jgi:hypothetical protein
MATQYRSPNANSAYERTVNDLGEAKCLSFHLQKDLHGPGKFPLARLNFPQTRSKLSGALSGIRLLRLSAN